ncbi:MAG: hypothetical protein QW815_03325 [Nitrososphaerota archaeon]
MGIDTKLGDLTGYRAVNVDISKILAPLIQGYGGLRNYNIWLKKVDEDVRFKREDYEKVYLPLLEKKLDTLVIHSRRDRRVRYP